MDGCRRSFPDARYTSKNSTALPVITVVRGARGWIGMHCGHLPRTSIQAAPEMSSSFSSAANHPLYLARQSLRLTPIPRD